MRSRLREEDVLSPDRILSKLINDYVGGRLGAGKFLYRASVVQTDTVGGQLEEVPPNPKGSIRARVITDSRDALLSDEDLGVFYPLFPFDRMPLKETEHVYVIFEDERKRHGLWITRIAEPASVDNPNITPGTKKYEASPDASEIANEQVVQDLDFDPGVAEVSSEFTPEVVPTFKHRVGDRVVEGSNNALIVIGRDRPTDSASGEADEAGTIDLVAGRVAGSEDMSQADDKSRVYISMKTDIDGNLSDILGELGEASGPVAAIGIKSDEIRIVARNGMKIAVEGGDMHIEGANIFIGKNAEEFAILAQPLVDYLVKTAIVNTPSGPGKIVMATDDAGSFSFFSKTVKVKKE